MQRLLIVLATCATFALATELAGQSAASPFVPVGHWSVDAVDRLHALGLAPPGTHRGQRSRTVAEIRTVLQFAAADGYEGARAYLRRFADEFRSDGAESATLTHAAVDAGAGMLEGDFAHGIYTTFGDENWTGARLRDDRTTVTGRGAALATLGRHLAAGAVASRNPVRTRIDELYGTARLGPLAVWGGRRIQGFGPGTSGIVISGNAPVDGGGFYLPEPFVLPWLFRYLGPIRAELDIAVLDANGNVDRPYFILTRGSIEPHPRVGAGVTRAGMIGAEDDGRSISDVLLFLVGGHTDGSEFDNQIAAVDAWFRPPAGMLPLLLYIEWGSEDSAGAWWDVPGIVAGVEVGAIPGLPWLSLLVERSSFEGSRSGNPPWYRHPIGFHDGWSTRDDLLGHSLGGHGQEWLVQARGNLIDGRLQLMTRGFTRTRRAENVYAPNRAGRSTGVLAEGDLLLNSGVAIRFSGSTESGSGWRRTQLSGALRLYLPRNPQ